MECLYQKSCLASGCCGPNADDWLKAEVKYQIKHAVHIFDSAYDADTYLHMNYKKDPPYDFDDSTDCSSTTGACSEQTILICGVCMTGDTLGNIMFGYIGKIFGMDLAQIISPVVFKKARDKPQGTVKYASYDLGYSMGSVSRDFCTALKATIAGRKHPLGIYYQTSDIVYVNTTLCSTKCGKSTKTTIHGQ